MIFKDLRFSAKVKACYDYVEELDDEDVDLDDAYSNLIQNDEDEYDLFGHFIGEDDED